MNHRLTIVQDDDYGHHHDDDRPDELRAVPKLVDLMAVLSSIPPPWQVSNLIPRGAVCVLLGDSQVGKTFMALELAASVATGADFLGRKCKKGSVVYLAAEGGSGLVKRLRALAGKHPSILSSPIAFWRQAIDVRSAVAEMVHQMQGFEKESGVELGLIVWDTLSQTIYGDENGQDMTSYVSAATTIARLTKCPVLILHHCGKDASRGARGNSSLRGNADVLINVSTDKSSAIRTATTDPAKGGKMRDGEPSSLMFSLKKVEVGEGETSCVLKFEGDIETAEDGAKKGMLRGAEQKFILQISTQIAIALAREGTSLDGPNSRPTFFKSAVQEAWKAAKGATGGKASPSYFCRALTGVLDAGHLVQDPADHEKIWLAG